MTATPNDPEDDTDFVNIINASLEPMVIDEGDQWLLAKLTDNIFELVFKKYNLEIQMEAGIALALNGLTAKNTAISTPYKLSDGRVSVTLVRKT